MSIPDPVNNLKKLVSKMPLFSEKGAERFIEWWWKKPLEEKREFVKGWGDFLKLKPCRLCFYFASEDLCIFCSDKKRDRSIVCVVSSPFTVPLIEKEAEYAGMYFVLGGEIINGKRIGEVEEVKKRTRLLKEWIKKEKMKEVVLATDFTSPGEATALYLKEELKKLPVRVTRLARGFHQGDSLGYSDPNTLKKAFKGREELDNK